jgi:Fe2+ or Zn2+ uptake regulation protein
MRKEILAYLEAHPQASDTAEGIFGWWIETGKYQATAERVRRVLERLALEGLIKRTEIAGGPVVYSSSILPDQEHDR